MARLAMVWLADRLLRCQKKLNYRRESLKAMSRIFRLDYITHACLLPRARSIVGVEVIKGRLAMVRLHLSMMAFLTPLLSLRAVMAYRQERLLKNLVPALTAAARPCQMTEHIVGATTQTVKSAIIRM